MGYKLKRGQKVCSKCNQINASRQKCCKFCSNPFVMKQHQRKDQITEWQDLNNGQYIKVLQGSGPYYISKKEAEGYSIGDKICMGDTGVYKVVNTVQDGIIAYGVSIKNGGFTYLYMGDKKKSVKTGLFLEPYKIVEAKPKKKGIK